MKNSTTEGECEGPQSQHKSPGTSFPIRKLSPGLGLVSAPDADRVLPRACLSNFRHQHDRNRQR